MTAPTRADLAHRALFWTAVADEAKDRARAARSALDDQAREELARDGVAPTWRIPDLGTVPLSLSQPGIGVVDEVAFLAWVRTRYPDEVEATYRVRPAWQAYLTRRLLARRADPPCDDDGEVIPGLEYRAGGQPVGVRVVATADAKVSALHLARQVLDSLTPGGET